MKYSKYKIPNWYDGTIITNIQIGNKIVRLLKLTYDKLLPEEGVHNLIALDKEDNIVWIAELPSGTTSSSYDMIKYSEDKLKAWAGSYYCEIDIETGKLLKQQFYTI